MHRSHKQVEAIKPSHQFSQLEIRNPDSLTFLLVISVKFFLFVFGISWTGAVCDRFFEKNDRHPFLDFAQKVEILVLSSSSFRISGSDFRISSFDADEEDLYGVDSEDGIDSSLKSVGTEYPYIRRRKKLPDHIEKEQGVSLWSMIKDNIGKDLTKVCLPVYFNEPLSSLQKCFEDLEYSYLIDRAYEWGKRVDETKVLPATELGAAILRDYGRQPRLVVIAKFCWIGGSGQILILFHHHKWHVALCWLKHLRRQEDPV